jgi:tRNA pseudouridine38-40 synthase
MGCGRTDTGVHAQNFYLHFDHDHEIVIRDFIYHANKILPKSIVVHHLKKVRNNLHARFDAKERSYVYRLKLEKDPFDHHYFHYTYKKLDFDMDRLNELAKLIKSAIDFTSFCKTRSAAKTSCCTILRSEWVYNKNTNSFEYHIKADRFLRGMIRLLVGAMLSVINGRVTEDDFKSALYESKPLPHPLSMDPNGLMLYGIKYDW